MPSSREIRNLAEIGIERIGMGAIHMLDFEKENLGDLI